MFLDNPQVVVVLMQIGGNLSRGQKSGGKNYDQHSWPSTIPSKLTPSEHLSGSPALTQEATVPNEA